MGVPIGARFDALAPNHTRPVAGLATASAKSAAGAVGDDGPNRQTPPYVGIAPLCRTAGGPQGKYGLKGVRGVTAIAANVQSDLEFLSGTPREKRQDPITGPL
jgi:hypothetical protein